MFRPQLIEEHFFVKRSYAPEAAAETNRKHLETLDATPSKMLAIDHLIEQRAAERDLIDDYYHAEF